MQRVLFLIPYPLGTSPSQRFRFEQYFRTLNESGLQYRVQSFLDSKNSQIFYKSGHLWRKFWALISGFGKRMVAVLIAPFFDFIFIHREVTPIGPPIFEWILSRMFRKKIIYDFDDAIWLTDRVDEPYTQRVLKWRRKVKAICRWSYKVSCGNEYLACYARKSNSRVVVNPTTVDTLEWHNPELHKAVRPDKETVTIGWTGSHSTLKYLRLVEKALRELEVQFQFVRIAVIADKCPDLHLESLTFFPWSAVTETRDLMNIDIGIMPLTDDEWTRGKCGFKALQYLALNKPVIASAVGVNCTIVEHGQNGLLVSTELEWKTALTTLIKDKRLRERMGTRGRKKVIDHYSIASNTTNFLSLFE